MRVRCRFCGAEYETPVTRAALGLVDRCEHCGRAGLRAVDGPDGDHELAGGGPDPAGPAKPSD